MKSNYFHLLIVALVLSFSIKYSDCKSIGQNPLSGQEKVVS
jgi:hypothetical protein